MQVAAGVQGYRAVLGSEAPAGIVGQHVLLQVAGGQLQALGYSFDWDREINTTDPKY